MKATWEIAVIIVGGLLVCARLLAQSDTPTTAPATTMASEPVPDVPLPNGMTRLFDGKTLDGWLQIPPDTWTVNNGAIASLGAGRGVIHTKGRLGRDRIV